jgi:DNA polymerase (family 10)
MNEHFPKPRTERRRARREAGAPISGESPSRAPCGTAPTNDEVARALEEMSVFLDMADTPFKPRAYEKAAHAIAALERPLSELYAQGGVKALDAIPGVGKGIAQRVAELLETGHCKELEGMRALTPVDVLALTTVEGLGPKHVKLLFEDLGICTLEELEQAARDGRIRKLPHFGEKTEQKILKGVAFLREARGRVPIGQVLDLAVRIEKRLRALPDVSRAQIAGSVRRRKETIGDVDFLVSSSNPNAVAEAFASMPEVAHVYAVGPTKTLVRLRNGLDADLRVVPDESWGSALSYFTGSKAHNVALRRIAQERGLKLNEYGLFRRETRLAGKTEEEIYHALDLPFIPPELREDRGEIAAAQAGELPELLPYGALRGDLQVQTSWTDGANSMEEMAEAAKELGLSYIAITDHTRDLPMARGNDEARLLEQLEAIRALDARLSGFRVLAGAEVNIRRDGSLDIDDRVLARLDVVGVGVHAQFQLPRREMTERLVRAMGNPHVDVLFHPTARALGSRPACDVDMDELIRAAVRTGTALEIDGHPGRLDLNDEHVRRAVDAGAKLVVDSDAHSVHELRYGNDFGIAVARRGWATCANVLNTLPVERLLGALKGPHDLRAHARSARR